MRTKTKRKEIRLSPEEAADLKAKAAAVGLTETALIRLLLKGYRPREKPDERFYAFQRELTAIGNNINQLTAKAHSLGFIDVPMLEAEAKRWAIFQTAIMREFLTPERDDTLKWQ